MKLYPGDEFIIPKKWGGSGKPCKVISRAEANRRYSLTRARVAILAPCQVVYTLELLERLNKTGWLGTSWYDSSCWYLACEQFIVEGALE